MMKRTLAILTALLFGLSTSAFAGGAVLSDKEMDGISAGDWVIITDSEGNQGTGLGT